MPGSPVLDTQIISYAMKGVGGTTPPVVITSVTAQEFLLQYMPHGPGLRYGGTMNARSPGRARSLPWLPSAKVPAAHPLVSASRMALNIDGRAHFEYFHAATALAVNTGDERALRLWTHRLERHLQNTIRARFSWLVAQSTLCLPLTRQAARRAESLYEQFVRAYSPKSARENTIRDLLILATALTAGRDLVTADRVLGDFAASHLAAQVREEGPHVRIGTARVGNTRPSRARDRSGGRSSFLNTQRGNRR